MTDGLRSIPAFFGPMVRLSVLGNVSGHASPNQNGGQSHTKRFDLYNRKIYLKTYLTI